MTYRGLIILKSIKANSNKTHPLYYSGVDCFLSDIGIKNEFSNNGS